MYWRARVLVVVGRALLPRQQAFGFVRDEDLVDGNHGFRARDAHLHVHEIAEPAGRFEADAERVPFAVARKSVSTSQTTEAGASMSTVIEVTRFEGLVMAMYRIG